MIIYRKFITEYRNISGSFDEHGLEILLNEFSTREQDQTRLF